MLAMASQPPGYTNGAIPLRVLWAPPGPGVISVPSVLPL